MSPGVDLLPAAPGASSGPVDVSDRAGRLLGILASIGSAVDVSDRAGRLAGQVSVPAGVDVTDRAARALGIVASITAAVDVSDRVARAIGTTRRRAADLKQVAYPAANTGATLTLPAAGVGTFHYITHLRISRAATALLAGGAILAVTTTNLGARQWRTGNQASITVSTADGMLLVDVEFVHPLKSDVANTASTIVLPVPGAAVSWSAEVDYYAE